MGLLSQVKSAGDNSSACATRRLFDAWIPEYLQALAGQHSLERFIRYGDDGLRTLANGKAHHQTQEFPGQHIRLLVERIDAEPGNLPDGRAARQALFTGKMRENITQKVRSISLQQAPTGHRLAILHHRAIDRVLAVELIPLSSPPINRQRPPETLDEDAPAQPLRFPGEIRVVLDSEDQGSTTVRNFPSDLNLRAHILAPTCLLTGAIVHVTR